MKKLFLLLSVMCFAVSCGNEQKKEQKKELSYEEIAQKVEYIESVIDRARNVTPEGIGNDIIWVDIDKKDDIIQFAFRLKKFKGQIISEEVKTKSKKTISDFICEFEENLDCKDFFKFCNEGRYTVYFTCFNKDDEYLFHIELDESFYR